MTMSLRFYEIAEANRCIQNPFTDDKLALLGTIVHDLGQNRPGSRQLDLACGQGEMLCQWAKAYGITGTGVDISEAFIGMAHQRAAALAVTDRLTFVRADAAQYTPEARAYDVASCIGATWIGGGTTGTLDLLRPALRPSPDSLVLIGELFWKDEPVEAARQAIGFEPGYCPTIAALLDRFDAAELELLDMVAANLDSWDRYQGPNWTRVHHWLRAHPDDPDAPALRQWIEAMKREYLLYERRCFDWAVFVLRPFDGAGAGS